MNLKRHLLGAFAAAIVSMAAWPALCQVSPLPANEVMASPSGTTGYLAPRLLVSPDLYQGGSCLTGDLFYNNSGSIGCVTPGSGGTGTVTSLTWTGGIVSIATPTTTPAFTVAGTSGGIPYFSGGTTWASSAALAANKMVLGGGSGAAPSTPVGLGTTTQLLHGNASGAPSFGAIVSADVATVLASPPCIGCTATSTGAFTALSSNTIFSNSGGAGYVTTTIDNSNDNTNGILVSGASTTKAQEITQSPIQIAWNPGFTGSPSGTFDTAAITAITTSTVNDQIYPWGIIGIVKNFTDLATAGNPNAVAINGTTFTQLVTGSSASSSWGGNFVVDETSAAGITNPTAYRVGVEIDDYMNAADTTDTGIRRIGLLVSCTPKTTGLTVHCGAGVDISPGAGTLDNALLFYSPNGSSGNFVNVINNAVGSTHYTTFISSDGFSVSNAGNVTANEIVFANAADFNTSPTISSGFCASPSIQNANGTAVFQVKIGTSCAASTGVIGLPSAHMGWHCKADDISAPTNEVAQTSYGTTSATLTNYVRTTGVAGNWGSADVINVSCRAF